MRYKMNDELSLYLDSLDRLPTFEPARMKELFLRYRRTQDPKLEKQLWEMNLKLVPYILFRWPAGRRFICMDMIQESNVCLKRAVQMYDPKRFSFGTYAANWILSGARRFMTFRSRQGLICKAGIIPNVVTTAKKGGDLIDVLETLVDPEAETSTQVALDKIDVGRIMRKIPTRERRVIKGRYWDELTLDAIGLDEGGVSKEWVRQLQLKAMDCLRQVAA